MPLPGEKRAKLLREKYTGSNRAKYAGENLVKYAGGENLVKYVGENRAKYLVKKKKTCAWRRLFDLANVGANEASGGAKKADGKFSSAVSVRLRSSSSATAVRSRRAAATNSFIVTTVHVFSRVQRRQRYLQAR